MFLGLSARIKVRMFYMLIHNLVLFATLIFTRLINGIFNIGHCWRSGTLRGGFHFFIYADIDQGGEVGKAYLLAAQ